MNKKILVIVIITLCIPAVIATFLLLRMSSDNLDSSTVYEVVITDPYGNVNQYDTDDDIELFALAISSGVSIDRPVKSIDSYKEFDISFWQLSGEQKYTLYLTEFPNDCLFLDCDGNWFRISSEIASTLLLREDMSAAYPFTIPPAVTFVIDGEENKREYNFANWYYKKIDGTLCNFYKDKIACEENDIYYMTPGSDFHLEFEIEPDWCDVKYYIDDTLIFDEYLSELGKFDYGRDAKIKAVFTVEWYQKDENSFYGKTIYEFYIQYDAGALWEINSNTAAPGELVYIRMYNIDNEEFKVETELITSPFHNIVHISNTSILLLPISVYNTAGEYTISLISDKSKFDIPITITEKSYETTKFSYNSDIDYFEAEKAFFEIMKAYDKIYEDEQLWDSSFIPPIDKYDSDGRELYWVSTPRFGEKVYVNEKLSEYRNYGINYVCQTPTEVKACANGKVIFAGETEFLGKTVVIEHGFGLKSVYGFLDEIFVFADSNIEKGWRIGLTGSSGTARLPGLYLAFSVNGIYLNPFNFVDENMDFLNISPPK